MKKDQKQHRKIIYLHDDEPNEMPARLLLMEESLNDDWFLETQFQTVKTMVFILVKYE